MVMRYELKTNSLLVLTGIVFMFTAVVTNAAPKTVITDKTLVQIAIVYKDRQITMYRNGRECADYTIKNAEQFGADSKILMGLRHLDANPVGRFFLGSIDDARIYNVALDANTIASLKPNVQSEPKPFAWWNFEDGTLTDQMKSFSAGMLYGKARIAKGKLHLDKGGAYLMATNAAEPLNEASRSR